MDSVGRYVAIFLAVILMILFPLQYIAQSQEETIDDIVISQATQFTDMARHQGRITLDMYEELMNKLDRTGELYDITIEVSHPVSGKEIAEKSSKDSLTGSGSRGAFLSYRPDGLLLYDESFHLHGNEKEASIINLNTGISHTHTDDCYSGDKHAHTGNSTSGGGCYGKLVTDYADCDGSLTFDYNTYSVLSSTCSGCAQSYTIKCPTSIYICSKDPTHTFTKYSFSYTCPKCGTSRTFTSNDLPDKCTRRSPVICGDAMYYDTTYYAETANQYHGWCGQNRLTTRYTYYRFRCNKSAAHTKDICIRREEYCFYCGYSNTTDMNVTFPTKCSVESAHYELNCGKTEGLYYDSNGQEVSPTCYNVVTGITATKPIQTINQWETIDTTATATYLDGHMGTVNCTASGFHPNEFGTQNVTLTYTGLVGNAKTNGTISCTVNVTVLSPVKLAYITATPESQSIQRYSHPAFTVRAYYDDGSNRVVSSGYKVTGLDINTLGTQTVTVSYTENGITKSVLASVTVTKLMVTCPICHTAYELDEDDLDRGCPYCSQKAVSISAVPISIRIKKSNPLSVTVMATYQDGRTAPVTGWTSNYDPNSLGEQIVDITYQGLHTEIIVYTAPADVICPVCGDEYSLNDDGTDPGCPVCSREVVSIDVIEESVTIQVYDPLNITVIATYMDGHTAAITNWKTDFFAYTAGTYEVTVYYESARDTLTVRVVDDCTIQCPYCGDFYDRTQYPTGCPVCSTTITGIEASLRYGGNQVRAGSKLSLEIILIYRDTHRAFTYSGYTVTGYNPNQTGYQTVTVHYQELSTTLDIMVVDGPLTAICPNGHEYLLNDDGTDPGCPYCVREEDKDTAIFYFDIIYTPDILSSLYTDGRFAFKKGDYLTVTIIQRDASVRSRMKKMFFGTNRGISNRKYTFGGEVS